MQSRMLEPGRRIAIKLAEGSAEVAMAGEAEIERQSRQIVVACKEMQCARQPEAQLVVIERQSFYLLENLREINRRNAQFAGDLSQSPAPHEIARQHELGSIYQFLATNRRARRMRAARPESSSHQSQCQNLSFQGFCNVLVQAVAQERHEGLRTGVDAQTPPTECSSGTWTQNVGRRQLVQLGFLDNQRQTAIAAGDGMADPIALMGIEKEYLVGFRHGLIMSNMVHIHTAIGKYKLGRSRAFFGAH